MTDLTKLKERDRVRITVEGEVVAINGLGVNINTDGCELSRSELIITMAELSAPTARVELLPPPVDPDVLALREILHVHQRSMTPPDSGWGDMSYLKGSYDALPGFAAALACFKSAKAGGKA